MAWSTSTGSTSWKCARPASSPSGSRPRRGSRLLPTLSGGTSSRSAMTPGPAKLTCILTALPCRASGSARNQRLPPDPVRVVAAASATLLAEDPDGERCRLCAALHPQLGEQAGDVVLHRLLRQEHP